MTAAAPEPVARRSNALAAPAVLVALAAVLSLAAALGQAATFPIWPLGLCVAIAAAAGVTAWRPAAALTIVPAALPLADFAPWSGRTLWDEFDMLELAVLPLAWWRAHGARAAPMSTLTRVLFAVWFASLAISLWRGGLAWAWPDAAAWSGLPGPWDAWRVGKGALWAVAFFAVARRVQGDDEARLAAIVRGVIAGLAGTVAVVVWERVAFVGLFDFASEYRVTGPFSAMHTGGATIECFLAIGCAAAMAAFVVERRATLRAALAALLALSSYAMMVTYSRNGYFALLAAAIVVCAAALRRSTQPIAQRAALAGAVVLMLAAALPVLRGDFASQRLAQIRQDFAVRVAHWRDALNLREADVTTTAFGAGLGRFAALHQARSAEPRKAGTVAIREDGSGPTLRLGPGTAVYVEQAVDVGPGQRLELALSVRGDPGTLPGVALCEKWLLTSAQCARATHVSARSEAGWTRHRWDLDMSDWAATPVWPGRPVKLALFHADGGDLDLARVQLAADRPLLVNGDFGNGLDRWYTTTDVDPPWHVHSLPVTVLLEQGWVGVLAWLGALALALQRVSRAAWRGEAAAAGLLAALAASMVSGSVNTLIDDPRMLWLLCVLLGMAAGYGSGAAPERPAALRR